MSQVVSFLNGAVTKQSLPSFSDTSVPGLPILKRLTLAQGDLDQIYDGEEGIRYMAIVEYRPGCTRGNHVHSRKNEFSYQIRGTADLTVEDPETKARQVIRLIPGDLVYIPAGIAHVISPLEPGLGIEFSPTRFDASDTRRYPLVDIG